MKYLIAGLVIGATLGQMWGYAVAGQHPVRVEVPVVGECRQPEQVTRLMGLMASMPLAITVTETGTMPQEASRRAVAVREPVPYVREASAAVAPLQRDEIAQLIDGVR